MKLYLNDLMNSFTEQVVNDEKFENRNKENVKRIAEVFLTNLIEAYGPIKFEVEVEELPEVTDENGVVMFEQDFDVYANAYLEMKEVSLESVLSVGNAAECEQQLAA